MDLVFDIEANHYDLSKLHTIHCIVTQDVDTEEIRVFDGDSLRDAPSYLQSADTLIGHNIIRYDLPAIQQKFPTFDFSKNTIRDTTIMSRMYKPKWYSHSLKKWGEVLRFKKGDYAEVFKQKAGDSYKDGDEWLVYNNDMRDYCIQDVRVNRRVYLECLKGIPTIYNEEALELEQYTTNLMEKQKAVGVGFDKPKALDLMCELMSKRDELADRVSQSFKGFYKPGKVFTPKVNNARYNYVAGSPMCKIEWTDFNPGSRDHIAYWLKKKYSWEPEEFTEGGKPKISESVLDDLAAIYPEAQPLAEYFTVSKRLSALSEGKGSWLNNLTSEGRIHGSVNAQGTVTYRGTHRDPNLGQVPKVKKDKEGNILTGLEGRYGAECRELFHTGFGPDWCIMGCDMSGIEFRLLAHYLHRFDGGELVDTVLNGDIHSVNQKAAKLPSRDLAKTFIYAFIYGGGDGKLGSIVGGSRADGGKLRAQFLKGMPALKTLIDRVTEYRKRNRGFIRVLDGRHIPVDHSHTTLNYLLQSAGAILSKAWMREFHRLAEEAGFRWGVNYVQLLWVHDEIQCAVTRVEARKLGELCVKAIENVGNNYKLNCPITGEFAIGDNWKETH